MQGRHGKPSAEIRNKVKRRARLVADSDAPRCKARRREIFDSLWRRVDWLLSCVIWVVSESVYLVWEDKERAEFGLWIRTTQAWAVSDFTYEGLRWMSYYGCSCCNLFPRSAACLSIRVL